MKVVIAGSRDFDCYEAFCAAIKDCSFEISHIISGGARGVDSLAERYAKDNRIPITIYYAEWEKYGKRAGGIRNSVMEKEGEALFAIWVNKSSGTADMIRKMEKQGKPTHVFEAKPIIRKSQSTKRLPVDDDIFL